MKMRIVKKFCVCCFLLLILITLFSPYINAKTSTLPKAASLSAILIDSNSGKILYEKNIYEKRYPASLTKVMTAIITLENCNLTDVAIVSPDAITSISSGYVTANLQVGEKLTIEQLLYVLMVGSSNDAAIVLAEHVSGSVEDFSNLMNKKAKELGCKSTNFVNPNGIHDENHYSTAYDLALISKYAMENDFFRKLVSTTYYKLPKTNKYNKEDRFFTTTNSLLIANNDEYYYKYTTGIKTGFTTPAGDCLIASATKNNLELISVVLGAAETEDGLSQRYLDTISLFEYGYENYALREVIKSESVIQTVSIRNATQSTKQLNAVAENDIYALISRENKTTAFLPKVELNSNLKAPIKKGEIIGTVIYTIEGIEYSENLLASNDVKESNFFVIIFSILLIICVYLLYLKFIRKEKIL